MRPRRSGPSLAHRKQLSGLRRPDAGQLGMFPLSAVRLGSMRVGLSLPCLDQAPGQVELFRHRRARERVVGPVVLDVRRRGAQFVEHRGNTAINPPEATGMSFWSINPYVGCEFGCSYCYARFAHQYLSQRYARAGAPKTVTAQGGSGEPFEQRIFVKERGTLLAALDRDLAAVRRRAVGAQNIVLGTATDPYQPAERQFGITRAVLQRLCGERGLHIGIITKSPLVCRDIDLLGTLADRHRVSVYVSLISVDVRLIRLFEARSPMPHARLRALHHLTEAGVRAGLIVAPVLPGLTDTADEISNLMAAAASAGTRFVYPSVLRLYPDTRRRFVEVLEREFPALARRYRVAFGARRDAPKAYKDAVEARFRRIAARFGIRDTNGAQEQPAVMAAAPTQLTLWGSGRSAERTNPMAEERSEALDRPGPRKDQSPSSSSP